MTDTNNTDGAALLPVTQAARAAYCDYEDLDGKYRERVMAGDWDNVAGVQAFARFERDILSRAPLPATQGDTERSGEGDSHRCETPLEISKRLTDAKTTILRNAVERRRETSTPQRQEYDGEVGTALVRNEHRVRGSSAPSYCTPYGTAVKQVGHLRAAIEQALKCSPKIRYLPTVPSATIVYDCGDPWEILRAALAHPAQATPSPLPATQEDAERSGAGSETDVLRALRNLLGSCTRHPVGGGDGGTYSVTAPTWEAIKDASETIRRALSTPQRQEYDGEAVREAEAWLRAISDWLLANDHDMALPSGILDTDPLDIADSLAALAHPAQATPSALSGDAGEALAWLSEHTNCELSHRHDFGEDDPEWEVHVVNGGRNDREWTLLGSGETIVEAIFAARAALPSHQGAGE